MMSEKRKQVKNTPRWGLHKTNDVEEANELIASGEWMEKKILDDGTIMLKKIKE